MKKRLIKEEISNIVCKNTDIPKYAVDKVINSLLDSITLAMSQGNDVQFAGFGTFKPKTRAARIGRNPRTNEEIAIPARVVPTFEAGKRLKTAVILGNKEDE